MDKPRQRYTVASKIPLQHWARGRIAALGQAAYPIIPGATPPLAPPTLPLPWLHSLL